MAFLAGPCGARILHRRCAIVNFYLRDFIHRQAPRIRYFVDGHRAASANFAGWGRVLLAIRRHRSIAKVAMGRRMAIRLYWMWRNGCDYSPSLEFGSYAGQLEKRQGGR